jgi:catecholate siderophore receptor
MALSLGVSAQNSQSAEQKEKELPTVKVSATADVPTDGMKASSTRVGKTLQDPHEVPQAITSITRSLMQEQQVASLREAMRNVSGISFNAAEGGRAGDNMMLRGFYTFGDMYLDGLRDTAQYNRETFNLEQVDVLRGAAAMLFGRGQAGGVINLVTKTPGLIDKNKVSLSTGNRGYFETTGDFNKVLFDTTAVRVNVMKRDEGSWRANPVTASEPELHRDGVALSVGTGVNTYDELIFSYARTKTDDKPDYGVSFDASTRLPGTILPVNTYWGIERNFDQGVTTMNTTTYSKKFSPQTEWRTQIRHAEYERSYWAKGPSLTVLPDATAVTGSNPTRAMNYKTLTAQSDFNHKTTAWGMKHELITGVEYLREDSFRHSLQNFGGTTAASPPDFRPYLINTTGTPVRFKSNSYAWYAQDTVEFVPQWKLTVGARRDQMNAEYSSATSPRLNYGQWSTRGALSFHPRDDTHYYLGVSDSFSPTADLYQLTVTPLPPERSQVMELGAKWQLMEGDLALRAALYRANKQWERNTDLESTAAILTKKRRTDGIEFEMAGKLTPAWEVFAGVAFMKAKIIEVAENVNATTGVLTAANPAYTGQTARNTPPYTVNVWSTYVLGGGWKMGLGAEAKGKRFAYNPSGSGAIPTLPGSTEFHPNTAPAYLRWDSMLAYEGRSWGLRLNVQNLFNTVYYDAVYDNGGFTVPGIKRKITLTGEFKF